MKTRLGILIACLATASAQGAVLFSSEFDGHAGATVLPGNTDMTAR